MRCSVANIFKIHTKKKCEHEEYENQKKYTTEVYVFFTHLQQPSSTKTEHNAECVLTAAWKIRSNETKQKKLCSKYSEWKIV